MQGLRETQRGFADALLDPEREVPPAVISHTERRPRRRFDVYRNNVFHSLSDVLQHHFPVVTRLVGEKFFRATARAYIAEELPRSPLLMEYGAGFPAFLEGFGPVQDLPYLPDVARLEWLHTRAFHAADRAALGPKSIAEIRLETAVEIGFQLHPSLGLLRSPYPVVSIWQTNTHDEVVKSISLEEGGEEALVLRPELEVVIIRLPEGAYAFVGALHKGAPLDRAVKAAQAVAPGFNLQCALAMLIENGAIVGCGSQPHTC